MKVINIKYEKILIILKKKLKNRIIENVYCLVNGNKTKSDIIFLLVKFWIYIFWYFIYVLSFLSLSVSSLY